MILTKTPAASASVLLLATALTACSSSESTDDLGGNMFPETDGAQTSSPSPTLSLVPDTITSTALGDVYSTEDGLTLYTRYTDAAGVVTCIDECATTFPPLITDVTTTGISGQFDVIERPDGNFQWTLDGYPLHTYSGDAASTETAGEGIDNEWAVARALPVTSADVAAEEGLVAARSTPVAGADATTRNDFTGRTLYFFANDTAGTSSCNDACADSWPPLYADLGAVDRDRYSLITRDDGFIQWAYDGRALYFYSGDSVAGDVNGDGVGGVWSISRP